MKPVISNCGFYTKNIFSFLGFDSHLLAQKVKSYIKDTNHCLSNIKELGQLPEGIILCTIDVVGLYLNIPYDEGLAFLKDFLDSRVDKKVTADTLMELAKLATNFMIKVASKFTEQQLVQSLLQRFPPRFALFMATLEKHILSKVKKKSSVSWRYTDDIFFIWKHGEELPKEIINEVNSFHPKIKFTSDQLNKKKGNFLDVEVCLSERYTVSRSVC